MATDLLRLPIAEAARQLGCSVKTLTRCGAEGRLVIKKDGGRLYVTEASLRAYAGEQQESAGWEALDDLRALFPIPELEARQIDGRLRIAVACDADGTASGRCSQSGAHGRGNVDRFADLRNENGHFGQPAELVSVPVKKSGQVT